MQLQVYVSGETNDLSKAVVAFVPDGPTVLLPAHPYAMPWRYLSTISNEDPLFAAEGPAAARAVALQGFYIAERGYRAWRGDRQRLTGLGGSSLLRCRPPQSLPSAS
jgi:hypothetical protein